MDRDGNREPGAGNRDVGAGNRDVGAGSRRKPFWYLRRRNVTAEVDEELNVHIEMRIDELVASGMSRDDATREAVRQFGDLEATRRYCREQDETRETTMQRTLTIQDITQDLRIGIRSLLRVPVLTLTIIATVGIGIGATAAIFSAIDAAMLRPLPYAHPDRLVRIYTDTPPFKFRFSVADYLAFTEQQTRFEQHATYTDRAVSFSNGEIAEVLRTRVVSWAFFSVLGINPIAGRDFNEADGRPGTPASRAREPRVLAAASWRPRRRDRQAGSSRRRRLHGRRRDAAGQRPARSALRSVPDSAVHAAAAQGPVLLFGDRAASGERRSRAGVGRAARDQSRPLPDLEVVVPGREVDVEDGGSQDQPGWRRARRSPVSRWRRSALVWLIACANASNLLIARVTGRRQELAVRAALGASRGRVIRYLLVESGLLATGAAIVAIGIAYGGMQLLQTYGATYFPRTGEIRFDASMAWLMLALAMSSALLFGLVPALNATGGTVDESLRSSRSSTASAGVRRLRRCAGRRAVRDRHAAARSSRACCWPASTN